MGGKQVNRQLGIISTVIKEAQGRTGVSFLDLEKDLEIYSREMGI